MLCELLLVFLGQCLLGEEQFCEEADGHQKSFTVHVVLPIKLIILYEIFCAHELHQ